MNNEKINHLEIKGKALMDTIFRVGLIGILVYLCFTVASPFLPLILWGLLLAIMLYPLHQKLARKMKDKQGKASVVIVACGVMLIAVPMWMLGSSLASHLHDINQAYQNGTLVIPAPDASVADWPVIGERAYKAWNGAATNFPQFLTEYKPQIGKVGTAVVEKAGNVIGTTFLFIGALIIAGIMMAWAPLGSHATKRIICRLAGPEKGAELQSLIIQTVNSVARGVIGVAFIQALIFGAGFVMAGIPAAGMLAAIVMFIAILQLPTIIVALPIIILMWMGGEHSTIINIVFTVYFLLSGLADNILKPLLLGRGCDAPMPIILIGALGGMFNAGMIGMFLGAVLLALGYQILMTWSREIEMDDAAQ